MFNSGFRLFKMFHNPGGDWHSGLGAPDPYYILESKIKMEPKHHLIEKETHLPNLDVWVSKP